MMHEIHSIKRVEVNGPFSLRLQFEDGTERVVDLSGILKGEMFGPLSDPSFFSKVTIDSDFETIVLPNGADFDPETLYHWDRYREAFEKSAARWKLDD